MSGTRSRPASCSAGENFDLVQTTRSRVLCMCARQDWHMCFVLQHCATCRATTCSTGTGASTCRCRAPSPAPCSATRAARRRTRARTRRRRCARTDPPTSRSSSRCVRRANLKLIPIIEGTSFLCVSYGRKMKPFVVLPSN